MKRTRNDVYEEDWWGPSFSQGSVHDLSAKNEPHETKAVLWVPDPEQRHGWREFYVTEPKPSEKSVIGFLPKPGTK